MIGRKCCILIIDDEQRMTKALGDFFTAKGFHVMTAFDGQAGLNTYYANNEKIDLILLDVMMPIMDGFEVLQDLKEHRQDVPVIMLTAKGEEYDQIEGFARGAYDYITKPFSTTILYAKVENLLKLINKNTAEVITIGEIKINMQTHAIFNGDKWVELSGREFDLICYLVNNKNIVLSREKILNGVWGYRYDGDSRTVDTHIKQLRSKLGRNSRCIKTLYSVGYVFEANI